MTGRASTCECRRIETTFGTTEPTTTAEVARKLAAVRDLLARRALPAVVLRGTDGVAWVTGGMTNRIESGSPASAAWIVVTPTEAHLVTNGIELPRIEAEAALDGFEHHGAEWWDAGAFAHLAEEIAGASAEAIGGLGADVEDDLIALRLPLDDAEQERLAALAVDAACALEDAVRTWTPGELDVDVQARVASGLERVGAFGACLIVGGDDRVERFRHPLAAHRPMERLVMAVVVAERHGLHAAATRFASAGALAGSVRAAREVAARVERVVLDETRPQATFGDAVLALAEAYANAGHDGEWRDHYQGGPIGYRQREFELAPAQSESRWFDYPISAGTAVAWNPSVAGGGKCEDTYLVLDDGLHRLTDTGAWPLEDDGRPAILDVVGGGAA